MKLIVFAPHPDDEIIGCCGLISKAIKQNTLVKVVVVSKGNLTSATDTRKRESIEALAHLGVNDVEFWDEEDGQIAQSGEIQQRYVGLLQSYQPQAIAIPSPHETHPDHRRVTRGLLRSISGLWQGEIIFYETLIPIPLPNRIDPIDGNLKLKALALHHSQIQLYDYPKHISAIMALRAAAIGAEHAEAYLSYDWDGRAQNFFQPYSLVTVILRANDPFLLSHAIKSLIDQSYDNFEVLVVWHGDQQLPTLPNLLVGQVIRGPGPKSANLNLGLSLAQGQHVAFLDQDDCWLPDHLATLIAELNASNDADIIYGRYWSVFCEIKNDSLTVLHKEQCGDLSFITRRLLLGNFIAFNSFICSTKLAKKLKFDTDLDVYEDWDFLVRAELNGASFVHVPELVCEYRFYPEAGEKFDIETSHKRKGYLEWREKVTRKFAYLLDPNEVHSLLVLGNHLHTTNQGLNERLNQLEIDHRNATTRLREFDEKYASIQSWTELIPNHNVESNPLNYALAQALALGPQISIIMPVCDPEPHHLLEAIHSVISQTSPNWQLCIVDDASSNRLIIDLLEKVKKKYEHDQRVEIIHQPTRQGIVRATNEGVKIAHHDWIAFVDHDDRIHVDAVLFLIKEISQNACIDAIYTDSNTIDSNGVLIQVQNKSDWAPETLLHFNYINHLSCFKKSIFYDLGALQPRFEGVQDWSLWLDLSRRPSLNVFHLKVALYDWRATKNSVAYDINSKPYMLPTAKKLLEHHMLQLGIGNHSCEISKRFGGFDHQWPSALKPLTVIIPTRSNAKDLTNLIQQLKNCNYPNLQVILVAHQVDVADLAMKDLLSSVQVHRSIEVLEDSLPFNWARLNNLAAALCKTPWMLFLNDDVSLLNTNDLQELTKYFSISQRIGAVGAQLMTSTSNEQKIQHDGVWISPHGDCQNIDSSIIDHHIGTPRNVAAVIGACLLTTREAFDLAGGFDERFSVSYNDLDYCLHLRAMGFRIVQASNVKLIHFGSKTMSQFNPLVFSKSRAKEEILFKYKWKHHLQAKFISNHDHMLSGTRILNFATA